MSCACFWGLQFLSRLAAHLCLRQTCCLTGTSRKEAAAARKPSRARRMQPGGNREGTRLHLRPHLTQEARPGARPLDRQPGDGSTVCWSIIPLAHVGPTLLPQLHCCKMRFRSQFDHSVFPCSVSFLHFRSALHRLGQSFPQPGLGQGKKHCLRVLRMPLMPADCASHPCRLQFGCCWKR